MKYEISYPEILEELLYEINYVPEAARHEILKIFLSFTTFGLF